MIPVSLAWAQTYLRGFKVSLSEVEAALMACVGVEAAVALITEDITGVQRLVVRVPAARALCHELALICPPLPSARHEAGDSARVLKQGSTENVTAVMC